MSESKALKAFREKLKGLPQWKAIENELSYLHNLHHDKLGVTRSVEVIRGATEDMRSFITDEDFEIEEEGS